MNLLKKIKKGTLESSYEGYNENILNLLSPDSIQEEESYVRSGANFTRTLVAVEYSAILQQERIQSLNDISENISVIQFLSVYDSHEVRKQLSESIKQNNQKVNSKYVNDAGKSDAEAEIDSAKMTLHQLSYKNERMFMFQMLIHIVASDQKQLESLTQQVKTVVGPFAKTVTPMTKLKDAFDSFLPLGKNKVYDLTYRPMNAEAVSYFFPFHENEIFDPDGLIKGRNLTTGNVVVVDDEMLLNKHEFVIGMSGVGKSTYIFSSMMRKWSTGTRIRTIDPKGEFGKIYKSLGGEWVKFSFRNGSILNPFDIPNISKSAQAEMEKEGISEGNPLLSKINVLLIMFRLMYPDISDLQEDILSKYLIEMYAKFGVDENTDISQLKKEDFPIMKDFYDFLTEKKKTENEEFSKVSDFYTILYSYAEGLFSKILNGHTNVDVDNSLCNYDILDLQNKPKLQRVIYFLLLSHVQYEIINGDGTDTQFFIDEAHVIADPKVPLAMEQLYFAMKVLRSFNCGVTPASQSIKDFLSATDGVRNYGEAVISQATQRLYLPMAETEVDYLEREMNMQFSEEEKTAITVIEGSKKEEAGKGIFFVGSKKIKLHVVLTDLEKQLWFDKIPFEEVVQ
ncbi:VirB4 family type IV secretion system protein [Paenibacillus kribbensis]|uniref:VirB4 family type IV secretion system protein n=1 Tax=Paenibacillus kribbensis TaxID=172713 RepID=UPI0008388DC2|nr:TrsE [Paenibacillus kribbensis]